MFKCDVVVKYKNTNTNKNTNTQSQLHVLAVADVPYATNVQVWPWTEVSKYLYGSYVSLRSGYFWTPGAAEE